MDMFPTGPSAAGTTAMRLTRKQARSFIKALSPDTSLPTGRNASIASGITFRKPAKKQVLTSSTSSRWLDISKIHGIRPAADTHGWPNLKNC